MIFFALEMAVEDTMMGLVFAIYGTSVSLRAGVIECVGGESGREGQNS